MTVTDLETFFHERAGLIFRNPALLLRALTHSSYINEHDPPPGVLPAETDNERLEFLGDAVLDFVVGQWLYSHLPDAREGKLTRLRSALVRTETLAGLADKLSVGEWLLLGKGEAEHGGRVRIRNLCGAFEALCGALYLDQGIEAVRSFALPQLKEQLDRILVEESDKDAKSRLQEWTHVTLNQTPSYHLLEILGPEHDRAFRVEVRLEDRVLGVGSGSSKRRAEQDAAREAIKTLAIDS